jgi:hypothetical protein
MVESMLRPLKIDKGCQEMILNSSPLLLQRMAVRTRKKMARRRDADALICFLNL